MASPIAGNWLNATVPVVNPATEIVGTGFLTWRAESSDARIFLMSCEHVLLSDDGATDITSIHCSFDTAMDSEGTGIDLDVPLRDRAGPRFRTHRDPDIDVAAVEVTELLAAIPEIDKRLVGCDAFAMPDVRDEVDVSVGEDVFVLGYPLGLKQGDTNLPLVREGVIATHIGAVLNDRDDDDKGGSKQRRVRGYLVDGAAIPGSSGSPVVLKPIVGRMVNGEVCLDPAPPLLLGMIAQIKFAPIETEDSQIPGFAGLGLAYPPEVLAEVIDQFFGSDPSRRIEDGKAWETTTTSTGGR